MWLTVASIVYFALFKRKSKAEVVFYVFDFQTILFTDSQGVRWYLNKNWPEAFDETLMEQKYCYSSAFIEYRSRNDVHLGFFQEVR